MIKTYKYNDTTQLTEHFNVQEFRCKCGGTHDILIDTELVEKLEKLHKALKCSKIIVNSGYRCKNRDIAVGGSGYGQHTKGTAADIMCYDQDGAVIPSQKVCCAAQDIGFRGIANIDKTYTSTHLDVADRQWYGDETITTQYSICKDFYEHFALTRADVYGETAKRTVKVTIEYDNHIFSGLLTED